MDQTSLQNIEKWKSAALLPEDKTLLEKLLNSGNDKEIVDSFYKDLEFGTGGLRGLMGIGSNRMNQYTVGMATQGLANYLNICFAGKERSMSIAHDSRNNSPFFAKLAADILTANGIKVYLFEKLRPTPELSFAIRHLGCQSGIVITASHNPKEYNGYKAYWEDGAQVVSPHDKNIIAEVRKIENISEVKFEGNPSLIQMIGDEIDAAYIAEIRKLSINPESINAQKDISIVYSSIHGTGIELVPRVLSEMGFENVHIVKEQATPDGNFPTVVYPNPEEKEAMTLALNLAKEKNAELVLATDPDSDRVGIAIKDGDGNHRLLNGNQTGALLVYYVLESMKRKGLLKDNQFIVKTIVTTALIDKMAADFKVECFNTLTGFKYIASIIRELEGKKKYLVGGEESYGYLIGDFVRDKDAISSCAMIAEMAAWAKIEFGGMYQLLQHVYKTFGFFYEDLISITKKGKEGAEEITQMMDNYRANPPKVLGGEDVVLFTDFKKGIITNLETKEETPTGIESSNVLQFVTKNGTVISARPSGTEPKIKFYFSLKSEFANPDVFGKMSDLMKPVIAQIASELGI